MTKQADLTVFLFDGQPHLLLDEVSGWMESSSRFTAFVDSYRDKIRKKIRLARDTETALDLRGELDVAYRLLGDRRLDVAYEPYASAGRRGPDFAVTYRANTTFNVEVARMRMEAQPGIPRAEERLLRTLLYKLGQMQPGMPNLLVIHTREELQRSLDLERFMQELKLRVEKKEASFYELSRYEDPAAFYKDFLRLSGIVLRAEAAQLWINKQAKPALEEKVLRLASSLLAGAASKEQ
jgi:hypothetical protein